MKFRMSIIEADNKNSPPQDTKENESLPLGVDQINCDVFDPEAKLSISKPEAQENQLKTESLNSCSSEKKFAAQVKCAE